MKQYNYCLETNYIIEQFYYIHFMVPGMIFVLNKKTGSKKCYIYTAKYLSEHYSYRKNL